MSDKRRKAYHGRGFTILEILIGLLIVALVIAVTIPSFRSLTRVQLKSTSGQLVGLIRDTYSRAALSGRTFRIVFDMDQNSYWIEASKDEVRVSGEEDYIREEEDESGLEWLDEREREKRKYLRKPEFLPIDDEFGKKQKLAEGVRIFGVWVEGMKERLREGSVPLYFFPSGYTQKAQITLTDDEEGKHVMTLVTEPLTGEVVVENEELPIK